VKKKTETFAKTYKCNTAYVVHKSHNKGTKEHINSHENKRLTWSVTWNRRREIVVALTDGTWQRARTSSASVSQRPASTGAEGTDAEPSPRHSRIILQMSELFEKTWRYDIRSHKLIPVLTYLALRSSGPW